VEYWALLAIFLAFFAAEKNARARIPGVLQCVVWNFLAEIYMILEIYTANIALLVATL